MSIYFVEKPKSEKDLQHWKYIKKVRKPNGKWRYYYDHDELVKDVKAKVEDVKDKAGFDERERYKKAESEYKEAKNERDKLHKEADEIIEKAKADGKLTTDEMWNIAFAEGYKEESDRIVRIYEKEAERLLDEYDDTPLYKLDTLSTAVADGFRAIKNLFKKH